MINTIEFEAQGPYSMGMLNSLYIYKGHDIESVPIEPKKMRGCFDSESKQGR